MSSSKDTLEYKKIEALKEEEEKQGTQIKSLDKSERSTKDMANASTQNKDIANKDSSFFTQKDSEKNVKDPGESAKDLKKEEEPKTVSVSREPNDTSLKVGPEKKNVEQVDTKLDLEELANVRSQLSKNKDQNPFPMVTVPQSFPTPIKKDSSTSLNKKNDSSSFDRKVGTESSSLDHQKPILSLKSSDGRSQKDEENKAQNPEKSMYCNNEKNIFNSNAEPIKSLPKIIKTLRKNPVLIQGDLQYFHSINSRLQKLYQDYEDPISLNLIDFETKKNFPKEVAELSKFYKKIRNIRQDGNSFYRAAGFALIEHLFLKIGTNEVDNKQAVKLIESLDAFSEEMPFIQCVGYYLDSNLAEILKKPKFLACVLQQFLVFAYHENFYLKNKGYNEEKIKRKLIKLMVKEINQKPVLDVALIVFMRSFKQEGERKMGTHKFGKELAVKYFDKFSHFLKPKLFIFNLDDQNFDFEKYKDPAEKVTLKFWDNEFRISYNGKKIKFLEKLNYDKI